MKNQFFVQYVLAVRFCHKEIYSETATVSHTKSFSRHQVSPRTYQDVTAKVFLIFYYNFFLFFSRFSQARKVPPISLTRVFWDNFAAGFHFLSATLAFPSYNLGH